MNEKNYLNRCVIIESYNNAWPEKFIFEKNQILSAIGDENPVVEHIGSTAIVGLAAKPIIDIMVGVNNLAIANLCIELLKTIGYEYVPKLEEQFPNRRFFHKGPNLPNKHFHLHMVEVNSDFWYRQILFRDYLRANPKAVAEYQELKLTLSEKFNDSVAGYCDAKTDFIQEILKEAKESRHAQ